MRNSKLPLIGLLTCIPLLANCSAPLPTSCPPVASYSCPDKAQLESEISGLGAGSMAAKFVRDEAVLHKQIRLCRGEPEPAKCPAPAPSP